VGVYRKKSDIWKLEVRDETHNHGPAKHLETHAFARRMTPEQKNTVGALFEQGLPPRRILSAVRKLFPTSASIKKDIHNTTDSIKQAKKFGDTPMQVLENVLRSKNYVYYTRTDPDTEELEMIFFVHPLSYEMWRAFPHVLLIDATYKTNKYRFPLVQVIGLTSTSKSVSVAHAFIQKERGDNFIWVLDRIRDMLENCMEPRVIVTDRDLALMNAVRQSFPDATCCLCRWHIEENIAKYHKKSFSAANWERFKHHWKTLCDSESDASYDYNEGVLRKFLHDLGKARKYIYSLVYLYYDIL